MSKRWKLIKKLEKECEKTNPDNFTITFESGSLTVLSGGLSEIIEQSFEEGYYKGKEEEEN